MFVFNLVSLDVLIDEESCMKRLEKLAKFETFLDLQEDSEKKAYYQEFAKDTRQIIEKELAKRLEAEVKAQ